MSLKFSTRIFERVRRLSCLRAARSPSKRRLLHKEIRSQHETGPSRPCPLLVEKNGAAAAAGYYIRWAISYSDVHAFRENGAPATANEIHWSRTRRCGVRRASSDRRCRQRFAVPPTSPSRRRAVPCAFPPPGFLPSSLSPRRRLPPPFLRPSPVYRPTATSRPGERRTRARRPASESAAPAAATGPPGPVTSLRCVTRTLGFRDSDAPPGPGPPGPRGTWAPESAGLGRAAPGRPAETPPNPPPQAALSARLGK